MTWLRSINGGAMHANIILLAQKFYVCEYTIVTNE